ncbi:MAG: hypothetical protein OXH09_03535 [Gammaproteobacteria bacterium]|nr:hypothetical protein [Gammaproteobacteria bacterium]
MAHACSYIQPHNIGDPIAKAVDEVRLDTVLESIHDGYITFARDVSAASPNTKLMVHQYDYPPLMGVDGSFLACATGRGCARRYATRAAKQGPKEHAFNIVKYVVGRLAAQLEELPNDLFVVVPTLGTLTSEDQWDDELHPSDEGFRMIGGVIGESVMNEFSMCNTPNGRVVCPDS